VSRPGDDIRSSTWVKARAKALRGATHCAICGQPLDHQAPPRTRWSPSVDHVVPRSLGGSLTDPKNLRPVHYGCNSRRGNGQPKARRRTPRGGADPSRPW